MPSVPLTKLEDLRQELAGYGSCLIAYSGGVDSVFLAGIARQVLGESAVAVIADSPSLPRNELAEAVATARKLGIPLEIVGTQEFQNPAYLANPVNRCYFCKHELFTQLVPIARQRGMAYIVYGENASDAGDFRPGAQAAAEFEIRAPLKKVGLTKTEIRELARALGFPAADKPQMACLSSRIPYGEAVTPEKLKMIELAEDFLKNLGFADVRVRHHELPNLASPALKRQLARIEVPVAELPRLVSSEQFPLLASRFREIGYSHVTLDLEGYRRGGLNPPTPPG